MGRSPSRARTHVRALAVAALFVASCSGSDESSRAEVGDTAPGFVTRDLAGARVRLRDFRGETVVLNFWASWCIPCRREFPLLADVDATDDTVVLGVVFNDTVDNARSFMADHGGTWPGLRDDGSIARAYRVGPGIPATIVIGPDGKVRRRILGEIRRGTFDPQ
ncbi:MAG TPA: TlpA disulfide reductase family protein [Acidimicrobiales bacterium]|nr:TlpA disulfide reductase family protein [Acidimicrobiales bacterium]